MASDRVSGDSYPSRCHLYSFPCLLYTLTGRCTISCAFRSSHPAICTPSDLICTPFSLIWPFFLPSEHLVGPHGHFISCPGRPLVSFGQISTHRNTFAPLRDRCSAHRYIFQPVGKQNRLIGTPSHAIGTFFDPSETITRSKVHLLAPSEHRTNPSDRFFGR